MATLTDRPQGQTETPVRPPAAPPPSPPAGGRPPIGPNRRRDRMLALLYLFGPLAGVCLAAVAAVAVVVVLALGSGEAPATGAAELVPGNALIYLHVSTDPSRPAVRQALDLSRRLPGSAALFTAVTGQVDGMLGASSRTRVTFASDVRPWLGKEAALAVLNTTGSQAGSLIVLDVRNRTAARRFLARVGAQPAGRFRGIQLLTQPSGTMLAFVGHYLVLGQPASVQSAIFVAQGQAPSLATNGGFQEVSAGEPDARVLDAYASAEGIRRALLPRSGLLGEVGALLDQVPLSAAAISISPAEHGLRVEIHRTFSPRLLKLSHDAPVHVTPTLVGVLPAGSSLMLDVKGLHASAPRLLALASRAGVGGRLAPLISRLGAALAAQGVDLHRVLSIFSGETAIGLVPGRPGGGPVPVIVARTARPQVTRSVLASLVGPLTQVFTPPSNAPGQVPEPGEANVAGVTVHELSLAPGFGLDYAVARGLVVLSTQPEGVAGVFAHRRALTDAADFQAAVPDHPDKVTSLVFFDLSRLLRLGSRLGLIGAPQAMLWPAVEKIRAVGLASWRGATDTTTELQLQIP